MLAMFGAVGQTSDTILFMKKSLYSQDGVDVHNESSFSSYAGSICKGSYNNSRFVEVHDLSEGQFRGPRPITFKNLPEKVLIELSSDGIGTKGILHDAAKTYDQVAYDLMAMVASDITRYGGLPLVITNTFDILEVGEEGGEENTNYRKILEGLGKVAKESKAVVLKGETAQMTDCIASEIKTSKNKFNWGATMLGAYLPEKMVTGNTVKEGQVIVALKENGFRCNGISSVRKALRMKYGAEWWDNPDGMEDIKQTATPSILYDEFINTLHGWYADDLKPEITLHAIVHLSGGAIHEKLAKDLLFSKGLSADLDNLFTPPEIMKKCAEWRGISDAEFYETWNGGQGMLLIVDESEASHCIKRAKDFNIEAQIAGKITREEKAQVKVVSKLRGEEFVYSE